jgi:hypothetical protein
MVNFKKIIKYFKLFFFIGISILFINSIYKYSELTGLTKIKKINIVGNHFIKTEIIKNYININDDLLGINISEIQNKITNIDFIKYCRISRVFPSTLIVEIIENDPVAHIVVNDKEYILDVNGTKLSVNESAIKYFFLPKMILSNKIYLSKMNSIEFASQFGFKLFQLRENYPNIFGDISLFNFKGDGDVFMKFSNDTQFISKERNLNLHFKIVEEFKEIKYSFDNYSILDLRVNNQLIVTENKNIKS